MQKEKEKYKEIISKYVDDTKFYCPDDFLNDINLKYLVKEFDTEPPYNPRTHMIGYLRWKPYVILKTLMECDYGDIVYYRDCNISKYPAILDNIENTRETIEFVLRINNTDIYVPLESHTDLKMKNYIKREVFEYFNCYNNNYFESLLFNASLVICRKSDFTIKFITKWLEACKDDNIISCKYDKNIQHVDFKWNTQEQSILNVLLKKYIEKNKLPYKFPLFSFPSPGHRLFSINTFKKVPRIAILLAGEARNYDNEFLINSNRINLFDKYDCDVFISTWDKRGYSGYHGTIDKKNYTENYVTGDDIVNLYNNIRDVNIESYDEWLNNLRSDYKKLFNEGFKCGDKILSASVFPQLYKIWDANRLKCQFEHKMNFKYDIVIRYRFDMCIIDPIPREFLEIFYGHMDGNNLLSTQNTIWTLNPPKIFYPNRIYDIFFYGNSDAMDKLTSIWNNLSECINDSYNNGLEKNDACRVLYVGCLMFKLDVKYIYRCIGDIYRDENFSDYVNKIKYEFN